MYPLDDLVSNVCPLLTTATLPKRLSHKRGEEVDVVYVRDGKTNDRSMVGSRWSKVRFESEELFFGRIWMMRQLGLISTNVSVTVLAYPV